MAEAGKEVEAVKRICVDWDGTLVDEQWPEMGEWLPGAVEALKELAQRYDEVVIFSCRLAEFETDEITPRDNYDQIIEMNAMLHDAEIPENVILWTKDYKPPAEFYIDDKAIRFSGDWAVTSAAVIGAISATDFYPPPMPISDSDPGDENDQDAMFTPDWVMEQMNRESAEENRPEPSFLWATIDPSDLRLRTFETGATRDTAEGKPAYASYLSPLVLKSYGEYMMKHELQANGERREPGNWKKGMPKQAYLESLFRHLMDLWLTHDGYAEEARESIEEALNAILFNASGYLHELLVD